MGREWEGAGKADGCPCFTVLVRTSPKYRNKKLVHELEVPRTLSLRQLVALFYFPLFSPEWL